MKTRYDNRGNSVGFQEGDQVWLFNPKRRRGRSPKLQSNWEGPYTCLLYTSGQPRLQLTQAQQFLLCAPTW